ncbi:hypothetical protein ONS95_013925 [Cadophora gregata]|uniref:uncharacterized protein n=1 Tax=Cadophora gregata TaxID=51156 RepID=UPI0026DA74DF|nr:uncharacterized protein ONS95_013925 [Cadophora gregata]KAK0113677.1 hypothetical protein ONS96_014532 [Cadophora gregata f. sp. sojae]KAK0114435.1 hypothetical protein ONS95_013925 [Cadophora gregata]
MFAAFGNIGVLPPPTDTSPRVIPSPTPVNFPRCSPQSDEKVSRELQDISLVSFLQTIHRATDIKLSHLEAVGVHVVSDVSPQDLLPDASYLPPLEKWNEIAVEDLLESNEATRQPLSNGHLSPGVQTYRERQKELLTDNTAAFRTIRRIPAPTGETAARLGNAYEFFKNLEFFSGYWPDTSRSQQPEQSETDFPEEVVERETHDVPDHMKTHVPSGNGAQLPPDYRQNLLTAFVKLVAYDFGCNVSYPRTEPRLHLTPSPAPPAKSTPPPFYFNSSVTFVYRMPVERSAARAGIVEGPVATLSARASTVFSNPSDEILDLAREVVGVLLTAQHRSREGKTEKRFGDAKWWTTTPRWGGGSGGPIGREGDKAEEAAIALASGVPEKLPSTGEDIPGVKIANEVKKQIGGLNGPSPPKRSKKAGKESAMMAVYENYRKLNPPSATWDRRARYSAIGKVAGKGYDDIFLMSALNHHVSIVRARVSEKLLSVLEGGTENEWDRLEIRRTKWYDMYLKGDRVEAMGCVWGVMAWLMRKVENSGAAKTTGADVSEVEKMDLS